MPKPPLLPNLHFAPPGRLARPLRRLRRLLVLPAAVLAGLFLLLLLVEWGVSRRVL